ncbi:DUF5819 family protein [Allorhizocola rhizosphaerae]|uniref:DUF5819 family protein n=1 Tax=Allorhizocola rhizosphaerae TaxID=1872709 RepID=UPI001B8B82EC|nr:DUF5819 family protein [Allorhizocola rhizosphaerae]
MSTQREETAPRTADLASTGGVQQAEPPQFLNAVMGIAVAVCVVVSLVHIALVFLHVAPPNEITKRYGAQIDAWVNPFFEQNWRLFAPDPETATRQISVRTRTTKDGVAKVSDWFDLSAVDYAAIENNPFPSHTNHNMLRRAWVAYLETHGNDDQPHSERAMMIQQYLRNIAVQRLTAHRRAPFEAIQLRVITKPIARPAEVGNSRPAPRPVADVRLLPWWAVSNDS